MKSPLLHESEYVAFDMYFASIAAMQEHPGAGTRGHQPLSLEESKEKAMRMIKLRREVMSIRHLEAIVSGGC